MTEQRPSSERKPTPSWRGAAGPFLCAIWLLGVSRAEAVLFYWTGDTNYNTTAPTGTLTNSGWQYQGEWGIFNGTVISSNCFITANHVGGTVGKSFIFRGVEYPTIASYPDTESDLAIWRVAGTFPIYAPLYTKRNEQGKTAIVIGRGTQRGEELRLKGKLKGWLWGPWDNVQRWGQNRITDVVYGGPGVGFLLRASFDAGANRNEADLSGGDSGGAIFIKDGKYYKLAGINHGVDGPYYSTNAEPGFDAALFDQRGFYISDNNGGWVPISLRGGKMPGRFYATSISARASWITSVTSAAAP
jgi:hypothetical protein